MPCAVHDHLELACVAAATLRMALLSGEVVVLLPRTISIADKAEWLECQKGDEVINIRLDTIRWFEPAHNSELFERVVLPAE